MKTITHVAMISLTFSFLGIAHTQAQQMQNDAITVSQLEQKVKELTLLLTSMQQNLSALATVDVKQPTEPKSTRKNEAVSGTIRLSWNPSTDNLSVAGYKIFRDGVEISVTGCCVFIDKEANTEDESTYTIQAYDMAGNHSSHALVKNMDSADWVDTTVTTTERSYKLSRDLKRGDIGEDVRVLQQFLNTRGFTIAREGEGSPGNESTFFGSGTEQALKRFQDAHRAQILAPIGRTNGTGYLGTTTREFINSMI